MADHLAQRFGTEKDRVNCPFYIKIGCALCFLCWLCASTFHASTGALSSRCSYYILHTTSFALRPHVHKRLGSTQLVHTCRACRHGDRCSRHHNKPHLSSTILMPNLYMNPSLNAPLGPDGLPVVVDGKFVQEDYEVRPRLRVPLCMLQLSCVAHVTASPRLYTCS